MCDDCFVELRDSILSFRIESEEKLDKVFN